jgi:hypothetical protein
MSMPETQKAPEAVAPTDKKQRHRSPAYPFINLEQAVRLMEIIWEKEKRHPVTIPVVSVHWNYGAKSSTGVLSVAALKKFGLLDEEGTGGNRTVKLSEFAIELIKFAGVPEERAKRLKIAAIKPELHRDLWTAHRDASDASIRRFLVFDRKFNENTVDTVIKEYRDTISFAKLTDSDTIPDIQDQEPESEKTSNRMITETQDRKEERQNLPFRPPANTPGLIEIPVPLPSGILAYYRVPQKMSEDDFIFYTSLIGHYKKGLTGSGEETPKPTAPCNG